MEKGGRETSRGGREGEACKDPAPAAGSGDGARGRGLRGGKPRKVRGRAQPTSRRKERRPASTLPRARESRCGPFVYSAGRRCVCCCELLGLWWFVTAVKEANTARQREPAGWSWGPGAQAPPLPALEPWQQRLAFLFPTPARKPGRTGS